MAINLSSFLQCRFNIFLYSIFGWRIARVIIFFLGKLYFYLNIKDKKRIENVVSEVIGSGNREADIKKITKNVFAGILSHYYEKLFLSYEEPEKAAKFLNKNIISKDLIVLKKKLLKVNCVMIVTGHYGAVEYIPALLAINDFPVSVIAKFKTRQLKKKVYEQAKKYNVRIIDAENTGNIIMSAIKELRERRILVTECDEIEEWRASEKQKISFLGKVTGLDRTINIIQKRAGAEIIFGIIHRYSLTKYRLYMHTHTDMLRALDNISASSVGETVLKFLEQCIYANPEQWYQWKKHPEIKPLAGHTSAVEKPASTLALGPVFGNVN